MNIDQFDLLSVVCDFNEISFISYCFMINCILVTKQGLFLYFAILQYYKASLVSEPGISQRRRVVMAQAGVVSTWCLGIPSRSVSTARPQIVMPLLSQGFGVVFSRYLLQEDSPSTLNAWLFNVQNCLWNMMGLVVRPLAQEFGWRTLAISGGLLTFVSLVLSAFTPSPLFLLFFSLLSGQNTRRFAPPL